jgi:hypothetical protein
MTRALAREERAGLVIVNSFLMFRRQVRSGPCRTSLRVRSPSAAGVRAASRSGDRQASEVRLRTRRVPACWNPAPDAAGPCRDRRFLVACDSALKRTAGGADRSKPEGRADRVRGRLANAERFNPAEPSLAPCSRRSPERATRPASASLGCSAVPLPRTTVGRIATFVLAMCALRVATSGSRLRRASSPKRLDRGILPGELAR